MRENSIRLYNLKKYSARKLSLVVYITYYREAPTGAVSSVENDSLGVLQLAGKFLPKHPAGNKIRGSKTCLWSLKCDNGTFDRRLAPIFYRFSCISVSLNTWFVSSEL